MDQLKPPGELSLDGNLSENWKEWIQGFELFLTATGIEEKSGKIQVATFLHVAGVEARRVYNTFNIPSGDREKLDVLKDFFQTYCEPRKNLTFIRHVFFTRNQGEHESIDSFVTDIKNKAKPCEFGGLADSLIRDRIVCGIQSESCRVRLLREAELSLAKCIDICRAHEISTKQIQDLKGSDEQSVAAIQRSGHAKQPAYRAKQPSYHAKQPTSRDKRGNNVNKGNKYNNNTRTSETKCKNCGRSHRKNECPAFGVVCHSCHKRNHYAKCCLTTKVHSLTQEKDEDLFVGTINVDTIQTLDHSDWTEDLTLNNKSVTFKLDTGAQTNILPVKHFCNLGLPRDKYKLSETQVKLVTYGGSKIVPMGTVFIDCKFRNRTYKLQFFVVDIDTQPILGKNSCSEIGAIMRVHSVQSDKIHTPLTKDDVLRDYDDVFKGLGKLPGTHHIVTDTSVTPVVHPPRKVPAALREPVRKELDRMVSLGVIEKIDEPTDWVHSMVTVRKPGKMRICIDPKDLNRAVKREHYFMQTVDQIIERLPKAKYFSRFDATHGFWQIALDDESSRLLTFNTPFGRYRYLRLPFGINSAPEVFSKRVNELFGDITGVESLVDDILVWGETETQHDKRVRQMLDRCRESNFKLNKSKFELRVPEVKYVGHVISKEGLKVDPEKVRAILEMPEPTDKQGVKRFLGIITYLSKFIPNMSDESAPLRTLLKDDVEWHWDKPQQDSFDKLKQLVSTTPVLKFYDVTQSVSISVDASSKGIGAVLMQNGHPVAFGSRALNETQARYAQIEREMLAVLYGCEKFHHYIYGRKTIIETDHKPLVAIHGKPIMYATPRLQRMLLKLQRYDIQLEYVPGRNMFISDALSRAYLQECPETLIDDEIDVDLLETELSVSSEKLKQIREAIAADKSLQVLIATVVSGWPNERESVKPEAREYWNFRDEITVINGILYKNHRLIIPKSMRSEMLVKLHEAHLGIVKTKQRAREAIYWPNMNSDIEQMTQQCSVCNKYRRSNCREPLIPHEIPLRPWTKVGADLFEFKGREYLLCVDYYSKYPEIVCLTSTTSAATIIAFKSIFARHGIPSEVVTDNGPQFSSAKFKDFASSWDFTHTTSSPRYPQSNGQSERCVQTVKNLLKKAEDSNTDVYIALLEYRATPIDTLELSPAQLLMNRQLKTKIPVLSKLLVPKAVISQKPRLNARQDKHKFYYDRKSAVLPQLQKDEIVRIRTENKQWEPAIVDYNHSNRSYVVKTGNGNRYRRNRRHLLKTGEREMPQQVEINVEPEIPDNLTLTNVSNSHNGLSGSESVNNMEPQRDQIMTRSGRVSRKPAYLERDYV